MQSASRLAVVAVLATASVAHATPCPNVMFVLDRSGSMSEDPNGGTSSPSKWQLLQTAVSKIVTMYGNQVPFGLEMFTSSAFDDATCYSDTMIDVEPGHGTESQIVSQIMAAMPDSGTNTGEAIKRAAVDPKMHDTTRQNLIVLITDGDPNCNSMDEPNADYTVAQIAAAANQNPPVYTFVIGFDGDPNGGGVFPDKLNRMAVAGKEAIKGCNMTATNPCYYSASNTQKFNAAIDAIINTVVGGEFGSGMCDDSCASNGCPSGQVCSVDETNPTPHCVANPCGNVSCPSGDFCRQGQCVKACQTTCASNQQCVDGNCVANPCASKSCSTGETCDPTSGACVTDQCQVKNPTCPAGTTCDPLTGNCEQNPCALVICPTGFDCTANGNCEKSGTGMTGMTSGPKHRSGCQMGGSGDGGGVALAALALAALALVQRRRRRA